jgi:hypothetical protein
MVIGVSYSAFANVPIEVVFHYYEVDSKGEVIHQFSDSDTVVVDKDKPFVIEFPDGVTRESVGHGMRSGIADEIYYPYNVIIRKDSKSGILLDILCGFALGGTQPIGAHKVISYPVPEGYEVVRADDLTFLYEFDKIYYRSMSDEAEASWVKNIYIRKTGKTAPSAEPAPKFTEMAGVNFLVNGEKRALTLPVLNISGRAMYPFRECLEHIGAEISWDPDARVAKGSLGGNTVEFPIDSNEYRINGQSFSMDEGVASFIHDGRTYIPLRYAAEALGYSVQWEASTNTIQLVS